MSLRFAQPALAALTPMLVFALAAVTGHAAGGRGQPGARATQTVSLDGAAEWRVAVDPKNAGREEKWWERQRAEARPVRVPGVYQEAWPGCHGVAWYWREIVFPSNPDPDGRYVLRFWQSDYLAEVWVNGLHVGSHEGGEEAFAFDATEAAKPGEANRIAVRVVCPGDQPVDGMTRLNTPQRGRACQTPPGGEYQCGGLIDSVELLVCPAVRVADLRVRPDWKTGEIRISTTVRNAGQEKSPARVYLSAAPAASGETLAACDTEQAFEPGDTRLEKVLKIEQPRHWSLDEPILYRVTARVAVDGLGGFDEVSTRCGFRDFRFVDGAFRLNGKRLFLRSSHTGNTAPAPGYRVPLGSDFLRRDLLNGKAMGFNMIRFFCSIPRRYQLDLCDEIGLLVYDETAAGWQWNESSQMAERFDAAVRGMITRDRNHPSVVMWGLLNETRDGPIFRHAVAMLPQVNALDGTRVTMLNSGLEQFVPADKVPRQGFGALCNPGGTAWDNTLLDSHPYQRYPHLSRQIRNLRDTPAGRPLFISEYGVGGAVDLTRQVRHYEQIGQADSEAARLYRGFLDRFMADWQHWNMGDTFASPEDYFRLCVAQMAGMRLEGLNALRANPSCVGHSMSGTFDHGFCGEGVMTCEFRELKPGVADAVSDGFSPLRLCLFTEPKHAYRGAKVRFDAVLANEDALVPGDYPVRLQIVGPDGRSVLDTVRTAKIQDPAAQPETPLAMPFFGEEVAVDGPTGKYRFLATFQKGGAAAGGNAEFYVTDPADMPAVDADVAQWGDDPALATWLAAHGLKTHPLPAGNAVRREVILVGRKPAADDAAWRGLVRHIAQGSTAVFLSPDVFKSGTNAVARVPLANKGTLGGGRWPNDWLYRHDHWAKRHPIFEGLPSGGLMDYTFYRHVISDTRWAGLDVPAELAAASIDASFGYDAGVLVAVYRVGAGRIVLNTLWIVEQLGHDPVAERLLRNMLRYAAAEAAQPLAALPPDFEKQQARMGY